MTTLEERLAEAQERKRKRQEKKEGLDIIDGMMDYAEQAEGRAYLYRNEIPPAYLEYADWFVEATGIEPDKKVLSDWIETFSYWSGKGLTEKNLADALLEQDIVYRPGTLTLTAVALKAKSRTQTYNPVIFRAEEQEEVQATAMPEDVRAAHQAKMATLKEKWAKEEKERVANLRRAELTGKPAHPVKTMREVMDGLR